MCSPAFRNLFVMLLLGSVHASSAQADAVEPMLASVELRADLQQLRSLLERKHPAPYRYTSRERMDQWFDSLSNTLNTPMGARAFLANITTIYPLLGDGHTLFLPADDPVRHRYLPIDVLLHGDSLFVRCDGPDGSGVRSGDRILMINGLRADEVVHALMQRQVRDGCNTTYPAWILDHWFRSYFRFAFGEPAEIDIQVRSADGIERSMRLSALPLDSIRAQWRTCVPEQADAIQLTWADSGIAVLTIPRFEAAALAKANGNASEQLRMAFDSIRERNVEHLVLDLRGNQGGDPQLAKLLLAHLLTEPFTLVAEGPASGQRRPVAEPYTGRLYTLMDGGSFSATGMVLAQLELHRRGALIGEEAGGDRTVLSGSARTAVLTHSHIACTMSRKRWQLVHRADDGHGVLPTHPVDASAADRLSGRDPAMEAAMRLISEGR